MRFSVRLVTVGVLWLMPFAGAGQEAKRAILSEAEENKLRETQDPGARLELYVALSQDRLNRVEAFKNRPDNPQYDSGAYLDQLLGEYIALSEEMKDWIEYHYEHQRDMRSGLRALLAAGPQQLATLRRLQESPGPRAAAYAHSLGDAVDQVTDMLDGATRALAEQEKLFPELKRQEKEAARLSKQRRKEEVRRAKEEQKLRKRQDRKRVPGEREED